MSETKKLALIIRKGCLMIAADIEREWGLKTSIQVAADTPPSYPAGSVYRGTPIVGTKQNLVDS